MLDILFYFIACLIWPEDKRKTKHATRGSDGEWIILDSSLTNVDSDDPLLSGEYDDGPDW
jgi:hypothetical protein